MIKIQTNKTTVKIKEQIAVDLIILGFAFNTKAQEVKNVSLEQQKGSFMKKQRTLSTGTFSLIIANNNLGYNVRFIAALEADIKAHVKNAYVKVKGQKNTKQNHKKRHQTEHMCISIL